MYLGFGVVGMSFLNPALLFIQKSFSYKMIITITIPTHLISISIQRGIKYNLQNKNDWKGSVRVDTVNNKTTQLI